MDVQDAVRRGDDPSASKLLLSLCYTSRQTFEETVAMVIEVSQVLVCSYNENKLLRAFLEAALGRFWLVRPLNFEFFSCFKPEFGNKSDLQLAVECKGLRAIKLGFYRDEITDMGRRPKTMEFFLKYRLERLLYCSMLKSIGIEHSDYFSEVAKEAAFDLGELLEQKFAAEEPKQVMGIACTRKAREVRSWSPYRQTAVHGLLIMDSP
jgi:hypothetical protein